MSFSAIARAARVSRDTVTEHARGTHPYIRRSRAARILATRPEHADPTCLVSALGSRRRIQTLYAAGYGSYIIARHAGVTQRAIDYILNGARATVTIATRNAIADAYRQLADKPVSNPRPRRRAEAGGWPGPEYWDDDDFDDPDFEPATGKATTRRRDIAENANFIMRTTGLNREAAAQRLGVSRAYIDHAFRDHPEYAIEVAA